MIHPRNVSAVLVTRGNVDLDEILCSICEAGIEETVIWDNSEREDLSCYGRYAAITDASNPWIYQQDDDLIAPVAELLERYDPVGDRPWIVANNSAYEHWRLTGRGVIFHRSLADCFDRYVAAYGDGAAMHRVADVIFAYQHPYRCVDLGWKDLPWATDPDASMYLQPNHYTVREQARDRARRLYGE